MKPESSWFITFSKGKIKNQKVCNNLSSFGKKEVEWREKINQKKN